MIEEQPLPGSIGLTPISGAVGLGIRIGQALLGDGDCPYEHAFLVLPDGQLIEAEPGGARIADLSEYAGREVLYVAPAGLTDEERAAICAAALKYRDVPYSFLDYAAIAAHRFHLPGSPLLKGYVASTRHLICSQLVDQCYQDAGIHLFQDGRWPGYSTPADLYRRLGQGAEQ
ncbi:hypothetical protein [Kitasatospora kifunensis]|uniref:Permuted papain-like amidase YaeF/Yiix C92 family enzyme n=1 Tax=Kitasatospora kifunensis TaxID=58351 RepID=A0A7W7QZV8_KITKI|nr:hypothetical protein [Kitasatospora kifunensis]MBB4922181.1 hypothetical protein [Kitasatospora kifunensis]